MGLYQLIKVNDKFLILIIIFNKYVNLKFDNEK